MLETIEYLKAGERAFIVCTGDSITEQNYHTNGMLNYVGQFSERLMDTFGRRTFVLNTGVSGDTAAGVLVRLERDVLRFSPDLVTVMVGMNDSTQGTAGLQAFRSNVEEIVYTVRGGGAEIMLLTQNPLDFTLGESVTTRIEYPAYVEAIKEAASKTHCPLCDIYAAWNDYAERVPGGHATLMSDPVHPNEQGQSLMARTLLDFLGI